MNASVYGTVAYIARYWFALLALIVIWRAIKWIQKDASHRQRQQSHLPDAGFIGEWVVLDSQAENMVPGMVINATRDGWVGSARACDIRVKSIEAPPRAARFYLRKDGLHILPQRKNLVEVDGEMVQREAILRHGATLCLGGVTLQLRLFAGVLLDGEVPVTKRRRGRGRIQEKAGISEEGPMWGEPSEPAPKKEQVTRAVLPKPALIVAECRNRSSKRGTTS